MRLSAIMADGGGGGIDPITGRSGGIPTSGIVRPSQVPPGAVITSRIRGSFGKPDKVTYGYPPKPKPVYRAPPPPPPQPIITVSPTFQQAFTPQVSPVIQTQVDSPYGRQGGGTEQVVSTPQKASGGSSAPSTGISPEALERALERQAREAEATRARELKDALYRQDLARELALADQRRASENQPDDATEEVAPVAEESNAGVSYSAAPSPLVSYVEPDKSPKQLRQPKKPNNTPLYLAVAGALGFIAYSYNQQAKK